MSKNSHVSKTVQLHLMHNVVTTAFDDSELFALFAEHGCTLLMFEEGKALYEKAVMWRAWEIAAEEALHETVAQVAKVEAIIRDVYAEFIGVAKLCFGRVVLEMLGVPKSVPRSKDAYVEKALVSFQKVLEHPELAGRLAEKGFGDDRLASVQLLVEKFSALVIDSRNRAIQLDASSKDYSDVSEMIGRWLYDFSSKAYPALISQPCLALRLGIEIGLLSELQEIKATVA
jgi:hypothetical protein